MVIQSLNKIIEEFSHLPIEEREYAIQIIEKQLIEAKREVLVKRTKEAMANFKEGNYRTGNIRDLYKDLEAVLK